MSLPGRVSDAGPDLRNCSDCGLLVGADHDCEAKWDWYEWLNEAEDLLKQAMRGDHDSVHVQTAARRTLIEAAEAALAKAKGLL